MVANIRIKLSSRRILASAFAVSAFTILSFILAGNGVRSLEIHEVLLLPLVCIVYGWPASILFLALGVPTLSWLNWSGRLSLPSRMFVGAVFTALPSVVLQITLRPERLRFLQMAPFFRSSELETVFSPG